MSGARPACWGTDRLRTAAPSPRPDTLLGRGSSCRLLNWQRELEQRAAALLAGARRKLPAMALNDHATNGQSQAHSFGLRRNEWVEQVTSSSWVISRARVFYCDGNVIEAITGRSNLQYPGSFLGAVHCFNRIADQI